MQPNAGKCISYKPKMLEIVGSWGCTAGGVYDGGSLTSPSSAGLSHLLWDTDRRQRKEDDVAALVESVNTLLWQRCCMKCECSITVGQ